MNKIYVFFPTENLRDSYTKKIVNSLRVSNNDNHGKTMIQKVLYKRNHRSIPGYWIEILLRSAVECEKVSKGIEELIPLYWMDERVFFPQEMVGIKKMEKQWIEKYHFYEADSKSDVWKVFYSEAKRHFRHGRIDIAGAALMYIYKNNPYFLKKYKRYYFFEEIAYYYESMGELPKSIRFLKMQTRLQPKSTEAHLNMSSFLILNGLNEEAIKVCKEGLSIDPRDEYLSNNLLIAYLNEGYIESAIAYLNQRINERPNISMNWKLMGDILCELESFDGAIQCFEEALETQSMDLEEIRGDIYYGLGICHQRLGHIRKAIKYYKLLLKNQQGDPIALLNLSKLYGEDLKYYPMAQKYAEELVDLYPENGYGHHNLGLIYFHTLRLDKAKWHLYRARKLIPDYQPVHDAIKELKRMES